MYCNGREKNGTMEHERYNVLQENVREVGLRGGMNMKFIDMGSANLINWGWEISRIRCMWNTEDGNTDFRKNLHLKAKHRTSKQHV